MVSVPLTFIVTPALGLPLRPLMVVPLLILAVAAVTALSVKLPLSVTSVPVSGLVRSSVWPAAVGPLRVNTPLPSGPRRMGSTLVNLLAAGTRSESKRYIPCHLSPGCTLIVSPAFGVSVTVLLLMLFPTRQAPLNVPPALVISIQWLAKYVGMSAER